jgi:hypothetical protein
MEKFIALLGIALLTGGCAAIATAPLSNLFSSHSSSGGGGSGLEIHQQTQVTLAEANYVIVKTNVVGKSSGFALLGFITVKPAQFQKAAGELYAKAEIQSGRPQTLGNVVMEKTSAYWILFSIPRVTVRADVLEFIPGSDTNSISRIVMKEAALRAAAANSPAPIRTESQ